MSTGGLRVIESKKEASKSTGVPSGTPIGSHVSGGTIVTTPFGSQVSSQSPEASRALERAVEGARRGGGGGSSGSGGSGGGGGGGGSGQAASPTQILSPEARQTIDVSRPSTTQLTTAEKLRIAQAQEKEPIRRITGAALKRVENVISTTPTGKVFGVFEEKVEPRIYEKIDIKTKGEKTQERREKILNKRITQVENEIKEFNTKYGGKELSSEEYAQAEAQQIGLEKEINYLKAEAITLKARAEALQEARKRRPSEFAQGAVEGVIGTVLLPVKLSVKPSTTLKEQGEALRELPTSLKEEPFRTVGSIAGGAATGRIIGGGAGKILRDTGKKTVIKEVPVTASTSATLSDAIKIGDVQGGEIFLTKLKAKTQVFLAKTGEKINILKSQGTGLVIVAKGAEGTTTATAQSAIATIGKRGQRVYQEPKITQKFDVKLAKTEATITQGEKIAQGTAQSQIIDYGKLRLRATREGTSARLTKKRLPKEYAALSNIKSKVIRINPEAARTAGAVTIKGESTVSATTALTDIYSGKTPIIKNRDLQRGFAETFKPKELGIDISEFSFPEPKTKGRPSKALKEPKTIEAASIASSAQLAQIAKVIEAEASRPLKIEQTIIPKQIQQTAKQLERITPIQADLQLQSPLEFERTKRVQDYGDFINFRAADIPRDAFNERPIEIEIEIEIQKSLQTPRTTDKQLQKQITDLAQPDFSFPDLKFPSLPKPRRVPPPVTFPSSKKIEKQLKKLISPRAGKKVRIPKYTASLGAALVGAKPIKLSKKQLDALDISEFTGVFEQRPVIELEDFKI